MKLTFSQRKQMVEDFRPTFELFCRILTIRIERVNKSSSSETVYYTLTRGRNRYKARISCHPAVRNSYKINSYDIDLVCGDDFADGLQGLFASLGVNNIKKRLNAKRPFF